MGALMSYPLAFVAGFTLGVIVCLACLLVFSSLRHAQSDDADKLEAHVASMRGKDGLR